MDQNIKNGNWKKVMGRSLVESTLGIIGVGNIGKAVACRAAAFGMRLLGNDPVEMPDIFLQKTGICMVEKELLLQKADFITINCDLNSTSFHLLGSKEWEVTNPSAYIINTARGPIIDENALISALQKKKIAGAALDVFESEPLPPDSPLRKMNNVLLAPHNANSSPKAWERVHRNTINNLLQGLHR